jgi:hypothetical protein
MNEAKHMCAIGSCPARIPTSTPICEAHRERLPDKLTAKIMYEFIRREQGQRHAALKYAEIVAQATALLYDPPRKR